MTDCRPLVVDGIIYTYGSKMYTAMIQRRFLREVIENVHANKHWDTTKNVPYFISAACYMPNDKDLATATSVKAAFKHYVCLSHHSLLAEVYCVPFGPNKIHVNLRVYEYILKFGTTTYKLVPVYEEYISTIDGYCTVPLFRSFNKLVGNPDTEFNQEIFNLCTRMYRNK